MKPLIADDEALCMDACEASVTTASRSSRVEATNDTGNLLDQTTRKGSHPQASTAESDAL